MAILRHHFIPRPVLCSTQSFLVDKCETQILLHGLDLNGDRLNYDPGIPIQWVVLRDPLLQLVDIGGDSGYCHTDSRDSCVL